MGYLKDIRSNLDIQAFPGARYEIAGEVPASQCSEAKIKGEHGETHAGFASLIDFGKFIGWNLAGKVCHITNPPINVGDYDITHNVDPEIYFVQEVPHTSFDNEYYITNGGELILTRNIQSFAEFFHAAGRAYTIKSGKLYTDTPIPDLESACTILFDPLT